ncbi:MAG: transposase [Chloroflexi bacterium]|nr:transposase [Chloroflexota bacterium]
MTYQGYCTLPTELLQQVATEGFDPLPELIRISINSAMSIERQRFLGVDPYEQPPERRDHANGYKPETAGTRLGGINFSIPRVRNSSFYPQALWRGTRSERALTMAPAEMYVPGVSTRKVAAITEELCG